MTAAETVARVTNHCPVGSRRIADLRMNVGNFARLAKVAARSESKGSRSAQSQIAARRADVDAKAQWYLDHVAECDECVEVDR